MGKKILITGGLGQDAQILSKIANKKYLLFFITNKKKFFKPKKNTNYKFLNLLNLNKTKKYIKKINPYAIIHLASKNLSAGKNNKLSRKIHLNYNFKITKNLVDSILQTNKQTKFIFAGSSRMFLKTKGVVSEKSKFEANDMYSSYKIKAHKYLLKKKKFNNLNFVTAILFNHDSKFRNKKFLLPRIVSYLKNNKLEKLQEIYSQNIYGDFSHAEDICEGIIRILELKKFPDKIILSSNKLQSVNKLINYGLKKYKIRKLQKPKIKTVLLIGNNYQAKRKLKLKLRKSFFLAFKEIIQNS